MGKLVSNGPSKLGTDANNGRNAFGGVCSSGGGGEAAHAAHFPLHLLLFDKEPTKLAIEIKVMMYHMR